MIALLVVLMPGLVAVAAVVLALRGLFLMRSDGIEGLEVDDLVLVRSDPKGPSLITRIGRPLAPRLRGLVGERGMRWLRRQVELAGRPHGVSAETVLAEIGGWLGLLGVAAVMFLVQGNVFTAVLALVAAPVLPLAKLSAAARKRQESLDRDLPDFLDVLAVTVAAGIAFRPALSRVAERFSGPIAEEIALTLGHLRHGASRREAFSDMRTRTSSEAVSQFVTAFLQAEELGAPLADSLRSIATDMRRTSAQRMRRTAAQVAPRVSLVTTTVLVPATVILIAVGMYVGSGIDIGAILGGMG